MFNKSIRLFSVVLAVILAVMTLPLYAFAMEDTTVPGEENQETVESENPTNILPGEIYEETSLREENVKHIHLQDGSYLAVTYASPVHYLDDEGQWQEIDSRLSLIGGEYSTTDARIKFAKKITGNENLFALHNGNAKLTFSLVGAIKGTDGTVVPNASEDDPDPINKLTDLGRLSSTMRYENILDGVDLEYITSAGAVKENLIVKEPNGICEYSFRMKLNNLTALLNEDGSVSLLNTDGDTVYYIPAPYVYDNAGTIADGAYYTLTGSGNTLTLTVHLPEDYVNSPDRAYPVTVDPAVYTPISGRATSVSISKHLQTSSFHSSEHLYVGSGEISYWKPTDEYTSLQIPANAYITDATFSALCLQEASSTGSQNNSYVGIYEVLSGWDRGMNYQTHNTDKKGTLADSPVDFCRVNKKNAIYSWNVTEIVQHWQDGGDMFGFALSQVDESTATGSLCFASPDITTGETKPRLKIRYRCIAGVADYWSYASQSAGMAGTGYVNRMTGGLTFLIPLLSTGGNLLDYTLSLVYDTEFAGIPYYYGADTFKASVPYKTGHFGYGFRLNANETVLKTEITLTNGETQYLYHWRDGNGVRHTFAEDSDDFYCDEDGLGAELCTTGNDSLEIKSADGTVRTFSRITLGGYVLTKITDTSGNQLLFTCDDAGKITAVEKLYNGEKNSVTCFTLSYSSNRLSSIYDSVAKTSYTFNYTGNYLTGVLYRHSGAGQSATSLSEYQYDSDGHLISAKDGLTQYQIRYTWTSGHVTQVTEYSGTGKAGQTCGFTYQDHYSEARSSGTDDAYGTSDDILSCYTFDNFGRCVSSYATNVDRNQIYSAASGAYVDASDNLRKQNKPESVSTANFNAANLLLNGGFELGTQYWSAPSSVTSSPDNPYSGAKCAKIPVSSTYDILVTQTMDLLPGTYTLSMMVCVPSDHVTVELYALPGAKATSPSSKENVGTYTRTSLSFQVEEARMVEVLIAISSDSEAAENVYLDDVMLARDISISPVNLVNYGGFTITSHDQYRLSDFWNYDQKYCGAYNKGDMLDGEAMCISGDANEERSISQTVLSGSTELSRNATIFFSGFARATSQMTGMGFSDTENGEEKNYSTFRLNLRVKYKEPVYSGSGETPTSYNSRTQDIPLDFPKVSGQWLYVSGDFQVESGCILEEIVISCEYNYQYSDASFDNIFVGIDQSGDYSVTTRYTYNEVGQVVTAETAERTLSYTYTGAGDVASVASNRGDITTYEYDDNRRQTGKTVSKVSGSAQFTQLYTEKSVWDGYGLLQRTSAAASKDKNGNLIKPTKTICYTYNKDPSSRLFGLLATENDLGTGQVHRYFYDEATGQVTASVNPDSTATVYSYDLFGRMTGAQTAQFTASGTGIVNPTDLSEVTYTYVAGNLSTITTESTTYTFSYDPFDNPSEISAGNRKLVGYTYRENDGKLSSITYGNGTTVTYTYDNLDRVSQICYTSGNGTQSGTVTYRYDKNGNLVESRDSFSGSTYQYLYNQNQRLMGYYEVNSETNQILSRKAYSYDTQSRLKFEQYYLNYVKSDGSTTTGSFQYEYIYNDSKNVLSSVKVNFPGSTNSPLQIEYIRDAFNRIGYKNILLDDPSFRLNSHYTYLDGTDYATDYVGSVNNQVNGTTTSEWKYSYDSNGNVTKITNGGNYVLVRYTYDDLGQLVREDNRTKGYTYYYTYDKAGNILYKEAFQLTINEGDSLSGKTPVYTNVYQYTDASWGDLLTSYKGHTITYDAIGNPLTYYGRTAYTFTWKNGRQLATATANGKTLSFTYNADGIRTTKTVDGVTHTYTLDGDRLVAEEWGNNYLVYLYDESGSPVGMCYRKSTYFDVEFDRYFFEKDLFGNIVAVYNDSGTKVASYCYDAWGNCTVLTNTNGIGTMNPFRYRGYYLDTETNLYYLQSRYYDSYIGRFINADDSGNLGLGDELLSYNLFSYCSNNPVMGYDPTGEWTFTLALAFCFNLAGAGYTFSIGVSFDSEGYFAIQTSYSAPSDEKTRDTAFGATFGFANISTQWTTYDSVDRLNKKSKSAGINTPKIGADVILDKHNKPVGSAITVGGYSYGGDIHVNETYTYTLGKKHRTFLRFARDEWGW